jgi:hypothetical protein
MFILRLLFLCSLSEHLRLVHRSIMSYEKGGVRVLEYNSR